MATRANTMTEGPLRIADVAGGRVNRVRRSSGAEQTALDVGNGAAQLPHGTAGEKAEDLTGSQFSALVHLEDGEDMKARGSSRESWVISLIDDPRSPKRMIWNVDPQTEDASGNKKPEQRPETEESLPRGDREESGARLTSN